MEQDFSELNFPWIQIGSLGKRVDRFETAMVCVFNLDLSRRRGILRINCRLIILRSAVARITKIAVAPMTPFRMAQSCLIPIELAGISQTLAVVRVPHGVSERRCSERLGASDGLDGHGCPIR